MENAIDAIKIAFGIFVFVIALSLAISVISQARATSDVIFHVSDKTQFYEYVTDEDVNSEDRIVGINAVIPTIHRYAKEQFAVSIFDKNGKPIARYDLWTEGIVTSWDEVVKNKDNPTIDTTRFQETYNEVNSRLGRIQEVVNNTLKKHGKTGTEFDLEDTMSKYYSVVSTNNPNVKHGAPWIGDNNGILSRIKADMVGTNYTVNNIKYTGKNLKNYKDKKFIEKFVEVTTSGETITDEEYSLETIKGNKKLEIIYIIQE